MIYEKIDLYEYFRLPRGDRDGGYLTAYVPEKSAEEKEKLRPAMLVVPGGGYSTVSCREGEPVAVRFFQAGYGAFVLKYTVKTPYPVPLEEAGMAMAYIRENAAAYFVDAEHVGAVGFSAGGHLAGMLATLFDDLNLKKILGERAVLVRPDAVILSYPVITTGIATHGGSADTISGGDDALRRALSLETRVTEKSSPAFIWHTGEDTCVPVENAFLMAESCLKHGVPCELHVFEKGWHGLSVINRETESGAGVPPEIRRNAIWVDLALSWLGARGFLVKDNA